LTTDNDKEVDDEKHDEAEENQDNEDDEDNDDYDEHGVDFAPSLLGDGTNASSIRERDIDKVVENADKSLTLHASCSSSASELKSEDPALDSILALADAIESGISVEGRMGQRNNAVKSLESVSLKPAGGYELGVKPHLDDDHKSLIAQLLESNQQLHEKNARSAHNHNTPPTAHASPSASAPISAAPHSAKRVRE
jgi:hypothetical protein